MADETRVQQVRGLIRDISEFINGEEIYPRIIFHLDITVLALISKAIRVAGAICILVEQGYGDEAFGMLRTLVDLTFTIRYIGNKDSFERSAKFVRFFAKSHEVWTSVITRHYPFLQVANPDHDRLLKVAQHFPSPHKWTGLGDQTKQMAAEADSFEHDASGNPVTMIWDYDVIYMWTSHYVHPTVEALDRHSVEPRAKFRIYGGKARVEKSDMTLFAVVSYLGRICASGFRTLKLEFPQALEAKIKDTLEALK